MEIKIASAGSDDIEEIGDEKVNHLISSMKNNKRSDEGKILIEMAKKAQGIVISKLSKPL